MERQRQDEKDQEERERRQREERERRDQERQIIEMKEEKIRNAKPNLICASKLLFVVVGFIFKLR